MFRLSVVVEDQHVANMLEPTHGQARTIEELDRITTDLQGAIKRALGTVSPEVKALIADVAKIRQTVVQTILAPPKKKSAEKLFGP